MMRSVVKSSVRHMSAAVAATSSSTSAAATRAVPAAVVPARSLIDRAQFPVPPPRDDLPLPGALFDRDVATPCRSRLREHYDSTLSEDLMYLTYNHKDPAQVEKLHAQTYVPGKNPKNQHFKAAVRARYHDTDMRKPAAARTPENLPRLKSIVVHTFLKDAVANKVVLLNALAQLEAITGKTPEIVRSKSNVAQWKLREGMPVGAKVELAGDDMWQFLDKLVELVLPRLKNWYGIPAEAGDGTGNVKMGFERKVISYFPEIEQAFDRYPFMCGFDLVFKTTAHDSWEARALLAGFQIPVENAASKAKREKYMQTTSDEKADEPEWMKYRRAKEEAEAKKKKGKK